MKRTKIIALVAGMLLAPATLFAQQALRSAYFLDGYSYRHQMNPALAPERGYVSMPILGNINLGTMSNVGVSTFLYKTGNPDKPLTTFMNESVSPGEFLDELKGRNRLNMELNMTLLSVGFRKWGGFNTVDLNFRSGMRANLPKELFEFMKLGMTGPNTQYQIEDIGLSSTNYAELALGHSRQLNDKWRVGAKVKFLFGLADLKMNLDKMNITMTDQQWMVDAEGEFNAAAKGLTIPSKQENRYMAPGDEDATLMDWEEAEYDSPGLSGFGLAFDLGATYQVMEGLEVSAGLLDLGFISWNNNTKAVTKNQPWVFDGFHNVAVEDSHGGNNSLEEEFEAIGDDLERLTNFHKEEDGGSRTRGLGATLNLGAKYTLPFYKKVNVGFLSSTRINGRYSWSEGRFSANYAPVKCFDASVNYAISSFGSSLGWVLNLHTKGFGFFVGADHQFFKVTPQYVPVNKMNMNFSLGINFTLGANKKG